MQSSVLIVDDNHSNRKLLSVTLAAEGYTTVEAGDGLVALAILDSTPVDIVISDVLMPNMDGYRFCAEMRSRPASRDIPFVFYTSTYTELSDEHLALDFGADLFLRRPTTNKVIFEAIEKLLKRRGCARVEAVPAGKVDVTREYSEALVRKLEKRSEQLAAQTQASHWSESRLRTILNALPDCVQIISREGLVLQSNPAGLALFGWESKERFADAPISQFVGEEYRDAFQHCVESVWRGESASIEFALTGVAGTNRWVELHAVPLRDEEGEIISLLGISRDNTARKELEAQFVQAQKMEVIGQLAGGVAHDFNNMLGIIMGYSQLLLNDLSAESPMHKDLLTIFRTGERAAALTRQLLIFSRKEIVQPQVLDLSEVVAAIDPMLRRLISENISLVTKPGLELGCVEADLGQIEQVLMNLVINARDAMSHGGTITVATSCAASGSVGEASTVPAEGYVVLSVADDGCGMSEEIRCRIFEAFFTTKPAGLGTGLGLATCQSIVKRWRGHITVESAVGAGTTFKVYFPRIGRPVDLCSLAGKSGALPRGTETILVVEDEPGLRELVGLVLEGQGYTVLSAGNGQEALRIIREQPAAGVSLVITDMVMPEMGGKIMAEWLQVTNPEIKMLFTSGYTDCDMGGALEEGIEFLPKPYTPAALVRRAREVIDRHKDGFASAPRGSTFESLTP
jgi:two-component system cell cycle sensor histidine kinase/response regulator CckA